MLEPVVSPHTIVLKGELAERHEELRADAAINPGYLCKPTATGIAKASVAGGSNGAPVYFAKEDALYGRAITDAYATGDLVSFHIAQPGDVINARVAANAAAILLADPITSAGDGTVKKATGSDIVIGNSKQALDNSAVGAEAFLKIEINQ